jgi:hypothetical protein
MCAEYIICHLLVLQVIELLVPLAIPTGLILLVDRMVPLDQFLLAVLGNLFLPVDRQVQVVLELEIHI